MPVTSAFASLRIGRGCSSDMMEIPSMHVRWRRRVRHVMCMYRCFPRAWRCALAGQRGSGRLVPYAPLDGAFARTLVARVDDGCRQRDQRLAVVDQPLILLVCR